MNLRTVPIVLIGILAQHDKKHIKQAIKEVLTRPDQLKDFVAYLNSVNPRLVKTLNQVKKALASRFATFNEYQLAKYNGGKGKIKLRDILLITHPKPADKEQSALWKRLLDDKLATPQTWETQLSKDGNTAEVWDKLIAEKSLGYMAGLRNLRNIVNAKATRLPELLTMLRDPDRVAKSKQFPFRFYSAYNELKYINCPPGVLTAIAEALQLSIKNVPELDGNTFTSADNSGSMHRRISEKSSMTLCDVANLMQAIFRSRNSNTITSVFGENFAVVNVLADTPAVTNVDTFKNTDVGHATEGWKAVRYLCESKTFVDRVIIFTDCQLWNSNPFGGRYTISDWADRYRRDINADCWFHIVNLAEYGTSPLLPRRRVNLISGFSEKILSYIQLVESGATTMIKDIELVQV